MRRFRRVLRLRRRARHQVGNLAAAGLIQVEGAIARTLEGRIPAGPILEIRRYSQCVRILVVEIIVRSRAGRIPGDRRFNRCARIPVVETARILQDQIHHARILLGRGRLIGLDRAVRHRGAVLQLRVRIMDGVRMIVRGCIATTREAYSRSRWEAVLYLRSEGSSRMRTFRTSHRLRHRCMPICHRRHRAIRSATTKVTS